MCPKVVVFARAPQRGTVKTRLSKALCPDSAVALHVAMVSDLIQRLERLRPAVDLELHTNIPTDAFDFPGVPLRAQASGDLGMRLYKALEEGLRCGSPAVLILGSDSPTVPISHISDMLASDSDVVLGPASDGGFYAICCRRAHHAMFKGVTWSASTTCAETAEAISQCGLTLRIGASWYDIDTPEDLRRLALDANLGSATRDVLRQTGHVLP